MRKLLVTLLSLPIVAYSGSLDPAAGPGSTMVTLQEMYGVMTNVQHNVASFVSPASLSADSVLVNAGFYEATTLSAVDPDLAANNLLSGVTVFGIQGAIANRGDGPTVTPTTSVQTVTSGYYGSDITVAGDTNLIAENIAEGVQIFGVTGTLKGATKTAATGGEIVDFLIGGTYYRTHVFRSSTNFTVTSPGKIDILLVGGGGAGGPGSGNGSGGGGGAGRVLTHYDVTVTTQGYAIVIGAGGTARGQGSTTAGAQGSNTTALGYTALGGGYGGGPYSSTIGGQTISGGNGGGGAGISGVPAGQPGGGDYRFGGSASHVYTTGGGGAGDAANGSNGGSFGGAKGGNGGAGTSVSGFTSTPSVYGGGGGGGKEGTGGAGGGGSGNTWGNQASSGEKNSGGGGGGGYSQLGGSGGSGIVIIRYPL